MWHSVVVRWNGINCLMVFIETTQSVAGDVTKCQDMVSLNVEAPSQ